MCIISVRPAALPGLLPVLLVSLLVFGVSEANGSELGENERLVSVGAIFEPITSAVHGLRYTRGLDSDLEDDMIYACVNRNNGNLRVVVGPSPDCRKNERPIHWNIQGIPGIQGEPGADGRDGATGPQGPAGLIDVPFDPVKLTAGDARNDDHFGWSVAISCNTAIIGFVGNTKRGGAYVFVKTEEGDWVEQEPKLTGSDASIRDGFGHSVAISGNIAVVGAPYDYTNNYGGSAYVFVRTGEDWVQ